MSDGIPFPPGALVDFYARDSGGREQDLSIEQQESYFRQWATDNGVLPGRVFADAARSGGSMVGRDALDQMLRHFQDGAASAGVALWDYSRLSRDIDDSQYILAVLRRKGYQVYSLKDHIPSGSVGRVVEGLYLWSAERYREELSRNIKRGIDYVVRVHKAYPSWHTPAGLRKAPVEIGQRRDGSPHVISRLEPDPAKAPLVLRAYELAAGGCSLSEIHAEIGLFAGHLSSYSRLLSNPIYAGTLVYGGQEIPDFCPAIVPPDLWQRVQAVRDASRNRAGWGHPRAANSRYLLSGMVRCVCGGSMTGNTMTGNGGRYWYYRCPACERPDVSAPALEVRVIQRLVEILEHPRILADLHQAARANRPPDTWSDKIERKRQEIADVERKLDNVIDALADRGKSDRLLARHDELVGLRSKLSGELASLEAAKPALLPEPATLEEMRLHLIEQVRKATSRQHQLALRSLKTAVTVERLGKSRKWHASEQFRGWVEFDFGMGERLRREL